MVMTDSPDPNDDNPQPLSEQAERAKQLDRQRLIELPPDQAQRLAEQVLDPARWHVASGESLAWPGDLGDEAEEPDWMRDP